MGIKVFDILRQAKATAASAGQMVVTDGAGGLTIGGMGYTFAIGDTIQSTQAPSIDGQVWLAPGDYLRSAYASLAAKIGLGPPLQTLEPMNIPRGGFAAIASNVGHHPIPILNSTAYAAGIFAVSDIPNGYVYECTTGGTTSGSLPSLPTTPGQTVSHGSVVWTCRTCVIVAASNSTGTGNCIAISEDNGRTYYSYPAPAAFTSITHAGGTTWLGCDGTSTAIYRSTDDGKTWARISTASLSASVVWSVAADPYGNAVAILGSGNSVWLRSTNGGASWASQATSIVTANGLSCVLAQLDLNSSANTTFAAINTSGATYQLSATAGTATARSAATGMNQLESLLKYGGGLNYLVATASGGTAAPVTLTFSSWASGGAFGAWVSSAPAACRHYRYGYAAASGVINIFGFSNTNAGTSLYFWTGSAWTTLSVAAYGIGVTACFTADSRSVMASTNTTAGNASANLTRFDYAGFDGNAAIPQAGATSFAFGEAGGRMWACNAGANTIQQLLVNNGTGWRTQRSGGIQSLADRIFDLGNNTAIITRGSNNILRSADVNATDPTWTNTAVFANFVLHDATNVVTMCWDSGSGMRRSLNRMSTFPTITNPTALTTAGFTFVGHGVVFDGTYWFPGRDVQGYGAFAKSTDLGLTWTIESTGLDNSQFDFLATNGTVLLALSKATGLVWRRTIGGSWTPAGYISVAGVGFVDFLYAAPRGQFVAINGSGPNNSVQLLHASPDGYKWRGYGASPFQAARGGYSPTLDRFFFSASAASNTPIISEVITFDNSTFFRLEGDIDHGGNMKTYTRAS